MDHHDERHDEREPKPTPEEQDEQLAAEVKDLRLRVRSAVRAGAACCGCG
jgi:hypothetical protein